MRITARMLGILSCVFILFIGISYTIYYMLEYDKYSKIGKYTEVISISIWIGIAICIYGFWILFAAWLVSKHPFIAFLIFLIPGGIAAMIALPFYRPNSLNLGQLTPIACGILLVLSCVTAFMGIWEKDDTPELPTHHSNQL